MTKNVDSMSFIPYNKIVSWEQQQKNSKGSVLVVKRENNF